MQYNAFEITGADAGDFGRSPTGINLGASSEALVQPLHHSTRDCVTIAITSISMAGEKSIDIDLPRATALQVSDEMLAAINSGDNAVIHGVARGVHVADLDGKPLVSMEDVDFTLRGTNRRWSLVVENRPASERGRAWADVEFEKPADRLLAELLRVMPFRLDPS